MDSIEATTGLATSSISSAFYKLPVDRGAERKSVQNLQAVAVVATSASPVKFVVGIQPTWDWNTNPKIGNKFTISLFLGAPPEITK